MTLYLPLFNCGDYITGADSLLLGMIPAVSASAAPSSDTHTIVLASTGTSGGYSHSATLDGVSVEEFDYVWHADPSQAHKEVKNAPAEYFTGNKPDTDAAVYIAHDVYYFPELPVDGFTRVNYDGEQEWVCYYTAEEYSEYIFANLPVVGNSVPTSMMHSEEEAYENAVLHITQAGTYILEGEWHGQIWIDLGDTDDTFSDENAKVTIILNGVDVTCTVAPALVFYSVYECDNTWEYQASWSYEVDTSDAGANVIIADGTVNNFNGENVYRMLKTTYKSGQEGKAVPVQKKMRKLDGAFYSYVSMNVDGGEQDTGILNIRAGYEGLDTELHLTINGGNINIFSQDDGINVNEDGVSVVTFDGGSTHILVGLGSEGDGIDSNGFLVVNNGTVIALANPNSDSGMDSDNGTYIKGGTVVALGSTMDWARADNDQTSGQAVMNLQFTAAQSADEAIIVTDTGGRTVFAYDPDKDEVAGSNARWYRGAIISAPGLQTGESYYVYVGGDVYGSETKGLYDVFTVTGFSSDAKQQCYSGTGDLGGFGGPGGMGGRWPDMDGFLPDMDGFGPGIGSGDSPFPGDWEGGFDRPQDDGQMRPDDRWGGEGFRPEGGMTPPDLPEDGTIPPDLPEGERPQGGFDGWNQGGSTAPGDGNITFTMTARVNSFSGVTDYTGDAPDIGQPVRFTDVDPNDWYWESIDYVVRNGLMSGTSTSTFEPDAVTTRGMLVTVLYRMEDSPAVGESGFSDVESGRDYSDAVAWAAASNIVKGYGDGTFGPNDAITREQMAVILYRYASYKGYDISAQVDLSGYIDAESISGDGLTAMRWANAKKLVTGTTAVLLAPNGHATRAQAATVMMRFCKEFGR